MGNEREVCIRKVVTIGALAAVTLPEGLLAELTWRRGMKVRMLVDTKKRRVVLESLEE